MAAQVGINDVAFCNSERCASDCGSALDICEQGLIGADDDGANEADVVYTADSGTTWTNAAARPFAAGEDVESVTCVRVDNETTRWIVARDTSGDFAEIAYSDDSGATWTNVDVEAEGTRGAADSGALFAYDFKNIWFVTTGGYIFYSNDGGITWTTQNAGTATANDYNAVHFSSKYDGFAVANTGVVVKTDDGGETWAAVTAITGTPNVLCVHTFNEDEVMVGTASGGVWKSGNAGTSWTQLYSAGTSINDLTFANPYVGWAADGATILYTRNGGEDWETITDGIPSDASVFNALWACDANYAFAVGTNDSTEAMVVRIYG